jgi:hypothetical protein
MLDAGHAKEKDPHIKHIHLFEGKTISKLLRSPHYLGRGYSRKHRDPEKYIKNKQICRLIDDIRYGNGSRKMRYARHHGANLHYKGFVQPVLNGGNADANYGFAEKLDLGNAGQPPGVIFRPHVEHNS